MNELETELNYLVECANSLYEDLLKTLRPLINYDNKKEVENYFDACINLIKFKQNIEILGEK